MRTPVVVCAFYLFASQLFVDTGSAAETSATAAFTSADFRGVFAYELRCVCAADILHSVVHDHQQHTHAEHV